MDDVITSKARIDKFVEGPFYDRLINAIQRAIDGGPVANNFRYPSTEEQKEQLRLFAKAAKAERLLYLERAREASVRKTKEKAEKKRHQREVAERVAEAARIAHESAAESRVAEIVILRGIKRYRAVLSSMRGSDPVSSLVATSIDPEDVKAAKQWEETHRQQLAVRQAERRKLKHKDAMIAAKACDIPKFRHLKVSRAKNGFLAVFQTTERMTLKSKMRQSSLIYTARSRLTKHRLDFTETPDRVEATCPFSNYEKFFEIVAVLDQEIEASAKSRLTPLEVEQAMEITSRERLRWTKDGRLPTDGTDSFRKNGVTITFSLHPYLGIAAIKPETIGKWRQDDIETTRLARSNGAREAVRTKARNDATRKSARAEIDKIAREASLDVLNPIAVPLVKLAILSTICSRWAKNRRDAGDQLGEAEFYDLKDRGLRTIHDQPWTVVRFVPGGTPRYEASLCERHRSDFRDERREYQVSFLEWLIDNVNIVRKCPNCSHHEDHDYYALYELKMVIGKAEFCWHIPYSRGRSWLPDKKEIEIAPPRSDEDGIVMFGRAVNDEEIIVWKPQKIKEEMEVLLGLFSDKHVSSVKRSRLP